MPERKATIRVETIGHEEAAAKEGVLADAVRRTGEAAVARAAAVGQAGQQPITVAPQETELLPAEAEATRNVAAAMKEAAQAEVELTQQQMVLNAGTGDYVRLLSLANPELSYYAYLGRAAVRVAGDLGQAQLTVAELTAKATAALSANAAGLLTLGAAGAALLGIAMIGRAWHKVTEEIEAATKAAADFAAAQTAQEQKREKARQSVHEALTAAGKATPEALAEGAVIERRLRAQGYGDVAAKTAAAAVDEGLTADEEQELAAAFATGVITEVRPGKAREQLERARARKGPVIAGEQATRAAERQRLREQAKAQIESFDVVKPWVWSAEQPAESGEMGAGLQYIEDVTGKTGAEALAVYDEMQREILRERETGGKGWGGKIRKWDYQWTHKEFEAEKELVTPEQSEARSVLGSLRATNVTINNNGPVYANRDGVLGGQHPQNARQRSGQN